MPAAHGIDIGAHTIELCTATPAPAKQWRTTKIDLTNPKWYVQLAEHIRAGDIVAIEPTGLYYSRPIAAECARHGAKVLYITHTTTAATRADRIGTQKTDANDARALAQKALDYAMNGWAHGGFTLDQHRADTSLALRLILRARTNAIKTRTRLTNRLTTLARGIWPALAQHKHAYISAIRAGAVNPAQICALAAKEKPDGLHNATFSAIKKLAEELPDHISAPEPICKALIDCVRGIDHENAEIEDLDAQIITLVTHPDTINTVSLWLTIPGATLARLAPILAATHYNPTAYDADAFKAACGCHPMRHESGTLRETKQTKRGYKPAKAALHLWTIYLLGPLAPPNPVRDYWQRLKKRANPYAIHAARAKLCRLICGIAHSQSPYAYKPIEQMFEGTNTDEDTQE